MNQQELLDKVSVLLRGWSLDRLYAEELKRIVAPILIQAGVKLK